MKIRTIGQDNEVTVLTLCDETDLVIVEGKCVAATVEGRRVRTDEPEPLLEWAGYDREPTEPQSFFDTLLEEA